MKVYTGIVQKGEGLAKYLGFSTINIPLRDEAIPGIYAAEVLVGDKRYHAAAFVNTKRELLEAHLLDFDSDLYGKEIEIELLEKIREDRRFVSEDEARDMIAKDVDMAREYFRVR